MKTISEINILKRGTTIGEDVGLERFDTHHPTRSPADIVEVGERLIHHQSRYDSDRWSPMRLVCSNNFFTSLIMGF